MKPGMIIISLNRKKKNGNQGNNDDTFVISDNYCISLINLYISKFSEGDRNGRFFRKIINGKGTRSNIGINTLATFPSRVATYLGLSEPQLYTSHSIRRTAASTMANNGATMNQIQDAGGWASRQKKRPPQAGLGA